MWCADEKGLDPQKHNCLKGITTSSNSNTTCTSSMSVTHLTWLSFLSLGCLARVPNLLIDCKKTHPDWQTIFPGAHILVIDKGSISPETFLAARVHWMDSVTPVAWAMRKVLIIDSGGIAWLHLSVAVVSLCCQYGVRPFILKAYSTCALMPADQDWHL